MATTIYNGLLYTTKEINRNFRIKINGIVDGKKVNKLVGVKGLALKWLIRCCAVHLMAPMIKPFANCAEE